MWKIGELELDTYFSDKEIEYVLFNISIDRIRVLATCTVQFSLVKEYSKELVKQILL